METVQLLFIGIYTFNLKYFRAAEVGSIDCAKVLLEYNADIDALNFTGQTAFHVVFFLFLKSLNRLLKDKTLHSVGSLFKTEPERTAEVGV
jgi:hypothetical protein